MNDMGPRRMDGFGRSAGSVALAGPGGAVQPAGRRSPAIGPQPAGRSAGAVQRPAGRRPVGSRPAAAAAYQPPTRQQLEATQPQKAAARPVAPKRAGGWKIALQFVIGLLIIVVVAGTIVFLYRRYYQ
jgi:hypothetical protein